MYDYGTLMQMLLAERQRQAGGRILSDEMGRPLFNEDGTSRYDPSFDPNSVNSWNNGLTGNQGVSFAYDPTADAFNITQGDATSGFQRWTANQQGLQDLGFEDYDRNGRMQRQWGTMAALAGAVVGGGALLEAFAPSLSTAGQAALGTSAGSGGAGTGIASAIDGMMAGTIPQAGVGAMAPAAGGGLTMEGILGSNFATNPAAVGATGLGDAAMYGAPATIAGGSAAMQGLSNTGPIDTGLSGNLGVPAGGTPGTSIPTGGVPRPGQPNQSGGQQSQSVLDQLMNGGLGMDGLMRLIAGGIGAAQQNRYGEQLLQRANDATPNRGFYEDQLKGTYTNPAGYLESPEFRAIQDITHNKLQRSDAAGGRLANDYGRQVGLQNQAMSSLDQYRRTLSGITGQNQATYSGQNSMFTQGAQADNSWMNGVLNALMSRPQGASGTPATGAANPASTGWMNQLPSWLSGGSTGAPQINLDAIY